MTLEHRIGRVVAVLGLLVILGATLTPNPGGVAAAATTPFWCLVCGAHGGIDVTLNLLLFIPFAVGLRLTGMSRRRTIAAAALLTAFVESMQAGIVVGRDPSLSDLLTNTIGGAIGAMLAPQLRSLVVPDRATARVFVRTWVVIWLALQAAAAWLLQPWSPAGALSVGWGVNLPSYQTFGGRLLGATADDVPLNPGPLPDSIALERRLDAGDVRLSLDAVVGAPHAKWAPAVALLGNVGGDGLVGAIFDVHDDIVLELPTNAARVRLANAALRLDAGRPPVAGERVRVTGGARGRTLWLTSTYGGERRHVELALRPSFAWSLLVPLAYAYGPETRFLTALWIAGLLLPLGYWTRWAGASTTRPPLALGTVVLGAVILGLAVVPWATGFAPVHQSEWMAAAVGLVAGWAVASRVAYLAGRCASPSDSESFSS